MGRFRRSGHIPHVSPRQGHGAGSHPEMRRFRIDIIPPREKTAHSAAASAVGIVFFRRAGALPFPVVVKTLDLLLRFIAFVIAFAHIIFFLPFR